MVCGITKDYKYIVVFIGGCILGGIAAYFILPARVVPGLVEKRVVEKHIPVVQEVVRHTTSTEVQYVPKGSILARQEDGSVVERKEKTDVDLQLAKPSKEDNL